MPTRLPRRVSRRRIVFQTWTEQLESRRLLTSGSEIAGAVFYDANGDGVRDGNDTGIPGVLISLTGQTDSGGAVSRRYLTTADGGFVFGGLQAGTYEVRQTQPSSITDGVETTNTMGVEIGSDRFSNIVVGADDTVSDLHFSEGNVSNDLLSPIWLLASAAKDDLAREMRATIESDAGNTDLAAAIRSGATEVNETFDLNQAPTAEPDAYSVDAGENFTSNAATGVLNNDTDPENSAIVATLVQGPQSGLLTLNNDGSFNYQPTGNFVGTDTFTYQASDGFKTSETVTVTITVVNPNAFSVSASGAVEGDVVGTVELIQGLDAPFLLDFVDTTLDQPEFNLVPDDHLVGIPSSPVVLIEYVDFACPACAGYHPILDQLVVDRTGDVLIVHRYFPARAGFNPVVAAQAVEAASLQDADGDVFFSAMIDALFDNQAEWTVSDDPVTLFEQYINDRSIALDVAQWRSDLSSQAVIDRVQRDFDQAVALELPGTPTYVLQGERISTPPQTVEAFLRVLDPAITAARENPFRLNRVTGELEVLVSENLDPADSPATLQVRGSDGTNEELVTVEVEITE